MQRGRAHREEKGNLEVTSSYPVRSGDKDGVKEKIGGEDNVEEKSGGKDNIEEKSFGEDFIKERKELQVTPFNLSLVPLFLITFLLLSVSTLSSPPSATFRTSLDANPVSRPLQFHSLLYRDNSSTLSLVDL
ncbi:hypothetical protein ZIOFF_013491 [Zingiber officinale]|uniref:Transmembrane protein n=1 Tax=Zingiber officinale TaxID=94328 RepID=A0A8J5HA37_ZINOF|nr:hypothetical protein ZIOFF_013491 [Zingiber officinale]